MSYSIEIDFLAQVNVSMLSEWSCPCVMVSFAVLNIDCWYLEEHAASDEKNPFGGGKWETKGKLPCFAEVPVDFASVTASPAAEMRKILTPSKGAVLVSLQSDIVCHAPLASFITCPSARLSDDGASIDIPNRRGLLVLIL